MKFRHEVAVAISIFIAMWALLNAIPDKPVFEEIESGWIQVYQQRLLPLRKVLPPSEVAGYISDVTGKNQKEAFFQLAQYVLAPSMIQDSIDHRILIGNFLEKSSLEKFCRTHDVEIMHAFPAGIYLLRRNR